MRDRLAETLVPMGGRLSFDLPSRTVLTSGNPQEILSLLSDKRRLEPSGEPSLQNGLAMAKSGMRWVHFFVEWQACLGCTLISAICHPHLPSSASYCSPRSLQPIRTGQRPSTLCCKTSSRPRFERQSSPFPARSRSVDRFANVPVDDSAWRSTRIITRNLCGRRSHLQLRQCQRQRRSLSALHSLRAVWLMAQTAPEALGNVLSPWAI